MNKDLNKICDKFTFITLEVLDAIIERSKQDPEYPFINTKLDIISGNNIYPPIPGEDYNAKDIIFSWIQGRGLEALTGHAKWLEQNRATPENQERISSIKNLLEKMIVKLEDCRAKNNGKMFFVMNSDGDFLEVDTDGSLKPLKAVRSNANFSDLFYSKGLMAAAAWLGKKELLAEAERYFKSVVDDIRAGRFISDQVSFDPKNKVAFVEGKHPQGPWMISLGGLALAAEVCDREKWQKIAREVIKHITATHINTGQFGDLEKYDFWEAVDNNGKPWEENNQLLCDPGHALEFVGLGLKCVLPMRTDSSKEVVGFINECRVLFPALLKHCFKLGFNPKAAGIVKAYDLRERQPVNTDMPWWSLPETIRAAAEVYEFSGDKEALDILRNCADDFLDNYINPDVHHMAYQTRDINGKVVKVIPATPDADPGYHTGLSLIDAIKIMQS